MSVRTVVAKTLAVASVPAVVAGVCIGLSALGVPIDLPTKDTATTDNQPSAAAPAPVTLTPAASDAAVAIDAMFDQIDTAWSPQGRRVSAAGLPHPLTCVTPAPGLSVSQTYRTKTGSDAQVTVTSYAAGMGAFVFAALADKTAGCKPSSTSMTVTPNTGVGAGSSRFTIAWSGNRATIEVVRRGDVLTFVATTKTAPGTVKAVDAVVAAKMSRCALQDSKPSDAYRNLVAAKSNYEPYTKPEKVTRDPATLPTPPAGVKAVKVPAKTFRVPVVTRPEPRPYPVWPDMPQNREVPVAPKAPEPQKTATTFKSLVEDVTGPGCGWSWMASAAPEFDAAAANATNDKRFEKATNRLAKDEDRWLGEVVNYWVAYADYRSDVIGYREYADTVAQTVKAWEVIDGQWATYWAEHDAWTNRKNARDRFDEEKTTAKDAYDDLLGQCAELDDTPPDPDAETPEPDIACPPERPAILDQKAPKVGKEPTKPKNPRPNT